MILNKFTIRISYTENIVTFSNQVFLYSIKGCTELKYKIGEKLILSNVKLILRTKNLKLSQYYQFGE